MRKIRPIQQTFNRKWRDCRYDQSISFYIEGVSTKRTLCFNHSFFHYKGLQASFNHSASSFVKKGEIFSYTEA